MLIGVFLSKYNIYAILRIKNIRTKATVCLELTAELNNWSKRAKSPFHKVLSANFGVKNTIDNFFQKSVCKNRKIGTVKLSLINKKVFITKNERYSF